MHRKRLTLDEFRLELKCVLGIGHRTVEIVLGNDPSMDGERLAEYVRVARELLESDGGGDVILMSEPLDLSAYRKLRTAGLDAVYCWQETYDTARYAEVHPTHTHKHDYAHRLGIFERTIEAGIPRYGMGVLFGLSRWEYDVLALLQHARWLTERYRVEPYAFGIPRMKHAEGAIRQRPYRRVTNRQYRLAVAVYRLCFPRAHIYMNTRENMELLLALARGGGSQVNTDASTVPGGYSRSFQNGEQFFHYNYDTESAFERFTESGLEPVFRDHRDSQEGGGNGVLH